MAPMTIIMVRFIFSTRPQEANLFVGVGENLHSLSLWDRHYGGSIWEGAEQQWFGPQSQAIHHSQAKRTSLSLLDDAL
jgi:hypothetical protein